MSNPTLYRTIVGAWLILQTHPGIVYVVQVVSQFVASPTTVHRAVVRCILRYHRGTVFQSLLVSSTSSLKLCAFSDANYGCADRTRPGYPPRISRVVPPSEVPLYNP